MSLCSKECKVLQVGIRSFFLIHLYLLCPILCTRHVTYMINVYAMKFIFTKEIRFIGIREQDDIMYWAEKIKIR